jgi:hypothetical protein
MNGTTTLAAFGPIKVTAAHLIEPARARLMGREWGEPRYSARLWFDASQTAAIEGITDAAIGRTWPDGLPHPIRRPLQHDDRGWWAYGAVEHGPVELFHRDTDGDVVPGPGVARIPDGSKAWVTIEAVTYRAVPWAPGVGLTLHAVCLIGADEPARDAAQAFRQALQGEEAAAA